MVLVVKKCPKPPFFVLPFSFFSIFFLLKFNHDFSFSFLLALFIVVHSDTFSVRPGDGTFGQWYIQAVVHRQSPMARGSFWIVPPEVRLGQCPKRLKAEWDAAPVSPREEHSKITLVIGLCLYFMFFLFKIC